ncbi:MAG: hypothetical protein Cons2KO_08560 [Congregibacter sp.]
MNSPQELQSLLQAELATLQTLHTAIEVEHEALLANTPEPLESATQSKLQAISGHAEQQARRLAWMQDQGLDDGLPFQELLEKIGGNAELGSLQQALASLAENCQDGNRRNGTLILRLQDRAQSALDILRGDEPGGDIYSLSGAREHRNDGRSLGKA